MRIIKTVLLYTTIIAVSILAILVVFGFIFQDSIVNSVKSEINQTLNSEIQVEQIEFSFISHFPLASVNMINVTGFESSFFSSSPDSLFHFQNLSLSFNILDVVQSNFILQSITLNDGFVNLEINSAGIENYLIIETDTADTGNFFLNLEQVNFENCQVNFRDFQTRNKYKFYFPSMVAKGTFSSIEITTALYGEAQVKALVLDNTPYLTNEFGNVDIGIEINLESGHFQISRGNIILREKYQFDVLGKSDNGNYAYTFKSTNLDLQQAETLIPDKHVAFINAYEISGNADIGISLEKKKSAKHPSIKGTFNWWDGDFKNKSNQESVQIPSVKGRFDLGKMANPTTTQIWVDSFELSSGKGRATGTVALSNIEHPWYRIATTGNINLLELTQVVNFGDDFAMQGNANFDVQITGSIQELDSITVKDIKTIKGTGKIQLSHSGFTIPNVPQIDSLSASIQLNQQTVVIDKFNGIIAQSPASGSVRINNWLDHALNSDYPIEVLGKFWMQNFDSKNWVSNSTESKNQQVKFPKNLRFQGHVEIDKLIHNKSNFKNFKADITYVPLRLQVFNSNFRAFDGELKLDFVMEQNPHGIHYGLQLITKKVNVQTLLSTYNNFGQTAVTDQHLRGELNAKIDLKFDSDNYMKIDNQSIVATGDILLVHGEMIENKLLTSIPSEIESNKILNLFINLDAFEERLHDIKFDTIQNQITVKDGVLTIPQMHVSSSALQIDISGEHSFDNNMNYYLSFNLSEVLTKKKKVNSEYGYIHDDGFGNRMMFLHVYTKNGKVEVDVDKFGSKKYRKRQSSDEVKVAKSVLKEEFGFFNSDTSITVNEEELKFDYELDLGEFADDSSSVVKPDSSKVNLDSLKTKKPKKKKTKKEKEEEFEEWDFEDDDY